ncbi:hypothetical protein PPL_06897 [Heterostelium album PN500]|uniref:F-box domain-containing protein n=1 Tax=Heterostelium pallidum (strain ATCC 26659 / Pp 5 / PN500) TaxID=670386 RepID=D3BDU4_HETP5|nr:hypothetical protein PPL_06897 [Heterostelium album PN500]EFA80075.1 hypothetical protein PPL_06897 [Heterostelium album PN500]|eukprot:XP_020432195.1 hypothetical protein PPL_06897 [Heterostelium album PN500]
MSNKENNEHHLLRIIVEFDENIDIISFSLVCKRWFDHRDKYLYFNTKLFSRLHNSSLQDTDNKCFLLNSYRNAFSKSIDQISDCTLFIKKEDSEEYELYTDYTKTLDEFKSSVLDPAISTVLFEDEMDLDADTIEKLRRSNVHTIQYMYEEFRRFPFKNKLQLPSNIKTIITQSDLDRSIYPEQLESLDITTNQDTIDVSVLPRSLKHLAVYGLSNTNEDFKVIPPNLETFQFKIQHINALVDSFMFPSTLKVVAIPIEWLKNIKNSHSIHKLSLHAVNHYEVIEAGDIPESVTHLTINGKSVASLEIHRNQLPSKLRYLKLMNSASFDRDSFASLEHLETLDLSKLYNSKDIATVTYPNNLKNLYLPNSIDETSVVFPPSLELLSAIGMNYSLIPKSITHLDFNRIPPKLVSSDIVKPNVRLITFIKHLISKIPPTVNTITLKELYDDENIQYKARRLSDRSFLLLGNNQTEIVASIYYLNP